jgi:hypothetical protein
MTREKFEKNLHLYRVSRDSAGAIYYITSWFYVVVRAPGSIKHRIVEMCSSMDAAISACVEQAEFKG